MIKIDERERKTSDENFPQKYKKKKLVDGTT